MFQFFKTPFSTKITNFTKFAVLEPKCTQNFRSKASNLTKVQFYRPHFFQKSSSLSPIFFQKISSLSPYFGAYSFFKPPFAALRAAHLYQNESWVPPGIQYIQHASIQYVIHNTCSLRLAGLTETDYFYANARIEYITIDSGGGGTSIHSCVVILLASPCRTNPKTRMTPLITDIHSKRLSFSLTYHKHTHFSHTMTKKWP